MSRNRILLTLILIGLLLPNVRASAACWSLGDMQNGGWNEHFVSGIEGMPGNYFVAGSVFLSPDDTWSYYTQWQIGGLVLQSTGQSSMAGYTDMSTYSNGTLLIKEDNNLWGPAVTVDVSAVKHSIRYGQPLNFTNGSGSNMDYYMEIFGEKDGYDYLMTLTFRGLFNVPGTVYPHTLSYALGPEWDHGGWAFENVTLSINPSSVPIPGAVWLLGSGLLGLFGIRKKLGK